MRLPILQSRHLMSKARVEMTFGHRLRSCAALIASLQMFYAYSAIVLSKWRDIVVINP